MDSRRCLGATKMRNLGNCALALVSPPSGKRFSLSASLVLMGPSHSHILATRPEPETRPIEWTFWWTATSPRHSSMMGATPRLMTSHFVKLQCHGLHQMWVYESCPPAQVRPATTTCQ
jgi:hypothetical protein